MLDAASGDATRSGRLGAVGAGGGAELRRLDAPLVVARWNIGATDVVHFDHEPCGSGSSRTVSNPAVTSRASASAAT